MNEQLQTIQSQYESAKKTFRSAMITYETEQTDEAYRIFEEEKAKMRGIFSMLEQLSNTSMLSQQQINQNLASQLAHNQTDQTNYQTVYDEVSGELDQRLASYPLLMEVKLRRRLAYIQLGLVSAGIIAVLVVLYIHSTSKPSTATSINMSNIKNIKNMVLPKPAQVTKQVKQTANQVAQQTQQLGKQYGAKTLEIADKAVVAGKKQGQKLYNQALNVVFGKPNPA